MALPLDIPWSQLTGEMTHETGSERAVSSRKYRRDVAREGISSQETFALFNSGR